MSAPEASLWPLGGWFSAWFMGAAASHVDWFGKYPNSGARIEALLFCFMRRELGSPPRLRWSRGLGRPAIRPVALNGSPSRRAFLSVRLTARSHAVPTARLPSNLPHFLTATWSRRSKECATEPPFEHRMELSNVRVSSQCTGFDECAVASRGIAHLSSTMADGFKFLAA